MKMSTSMILILVVIGIITGIMAGMLGIGGAIIMIPALVYLLGISQQTAQGTSLAVMLPPVGIIAAFNYYKAGHVNIKWALILAVFFLVGSYFGSKLALRYACRHCLKRYLESCCCLLLQECCYQNRNKEKRRL